MVGGVPVDDACQGAGDDIDGCLDHPAMQLEEVVQWETYGGETHYWAPACERLEGEELVTRARPARRLAGLAAELGERAFVHSICNRDWSAVGAAVSRYAGGE